MQSVLSSLPAPRPVPLVVSCTPSLPLPASSSTRCALVWLSKLGGEISRIFAGPCTHTRYSLMLCSHACRHGGHGRGQLQWQSRRGGWEALCATPSTRSWRPSTLRSASPPASSFPSHSNTLHPPRQPLMYEHDADCSPSYPFPSFPWWGNSANNRVRHACGVVFARWRAWACHALPCLCLMPPSCPCVSRFSLSLCSTELFLHPLCGGDHGDVAGK